ncbi:MAG: hypothetical protein WCO58_00785 [bacterium]
MNTISEVEQYLETHGFSDIVLPNSESQDSKYCSYVVLFNAEKGKKKLYILVLPCNKDKIIGNDFLDEKIVESQKETALRALFNDVGVTASSDDLEQLVMNTIMSQNKKQRHYVYIVNSYFGEFTKNFSDPNKGEPFLFPLEKLSKILTEDQKWILWKIKERIKQ